MQEMQETQVRSIGQEDSLEKEMATHSSILAWRMDRGDSVGVSSYRGDSVGVSSYRGDCSLVGYSPWGHGESDTTEHKHTHRNNKF